ncbi:aldo/keto reductase [Akkermansiaceae bacterium]|nr:aldo/keto reductase [Akkermansiaceae bacterium]
MKRRRLGASGIFVSEIGLGTMTFGTQCPDKAEAFKIMDMALEAGINFFDIAEIYPVPCRKELAGITEKWVGEWMSTRSRDEVLIATKVAGPAHGWFVPPVREGNAAIDGVQIRKAIEGSLKRLGTDYIDLYQVHWPDNGMRVEDTLETLDNLVKEGKVRAIGCSNENAYGLMKSLWIAEKYNWRKYDTIQNNFSINNRRFEDELANICIREKVSLIPYSPLAGGVLTGKYNTDSIPLDARFYHYLKNGAPRQKAMAGRFVNPRSLALTDKMLSLAKELNMHPATLATAWSKQHDFVASTLIGVSTPEQLDPILAAADLHLDSSTLEQIDTYCQEILYPMG